MEPKVTIRRASMDNNAEAKSPGRRSSVGSSTTERRHSIKNVSGIDGYSLTMGYVVDCGATEVFSLRYSDNGRYLVAALGDGSMQVINPHAGGDNALLPHAAHIRSKSSKGDLSPKADRDAKHGDSKEDGPHRHTHDNINGVVPLGRLPCTCLDFRPNSAGARTQNVFALGRTRGEVEIWHAPSHKLLQTKRAFEIGDESRSLLSMAWARDNSALALGCSDGVIRLLDGDELREVGQLQPARGYGTAGANPGHSNRVFSIKFLEESGGGQVAVSGGWDNCVHIWDVRERRSVQTIFGPHICGDAVDVDASGTDILTGSWRNDDQLQVWDRRTGKLRSTLRWAKGGVGNSMASCRLYAATFSHASHSDARFIAAGGGDGINECKVYNHHARDTLVGSILGVQGGVMSLAFAPHGNSLAIGAGGGKVHVVDVIEEKGPSPRGRTGSGAEPILMA